MKIMERYRNLAKDIRTLAYKSFHTNLSDITSMDVLIKRLSSLDISLKPHTISSDDRYAMFDFYNMLIKYFKDNEDDLNAIVHKYIPEKEHMNLVITRVKHLAIYDTFVKTGDLTNFDTFCTKLSDCNLSNDELTELFDVYQKMFWFNKGILHTDIYSVCLPNFMFNELVS